MASTTHSLDCKTLVQIVTLIFFFYLPAAFSRTWPVLPGRARGRRGVLPRGRGEGTSLTPAAAGCGGTHCGWQALWRRAAISFPGEKQEFVSISIGWTARSLLYLLNSPLHCQVIRR